MQLSVQVSVVVLTIRSGQLSALLVQAGESWALPCGVPGDGETVDGTATRLLADEIGLTPERSHVEQLRTYGPETGRVSVGYLAMLPDVPVPATGRFWPVADLGTVDGPALPPGDSVVVSDAVERARAKLEYTTLATSFCEEPFTLADLRRVYETCWGVAIDAPNFRRKVLSAPGFVVPLGATAVPRGGGRPAELHRRGSAALLHPPMLRPPPDDPA